MTNQSYIKYLLNKINSKLTIVSKILLLIFNCSLFIPIPTRTTTYSDVTLKLLTLYLGLVTTYGIALVLFLAGSYLDFILDKPSENNKFKILLVSIIIAPIISCVTYLIFNIVTPLQLASILPTVVLFVMYMLELDFSSHFNFDFNKIKRIFLKKEQADPNYDSAAALTRLGQDSRLFSSIEDAISSAELFGICPECDAVMHEEGCIVCQNYES